MCFLFMRQIFYTWRQCSLTLLLIKSLLYSRVVHSNSALSFVIWSRVSILTLILNFFRWKQFDDVWFVHFLSLILKCQKFIHCCRRKVLLNRNHSNVTIRDEESDDEEKFIYVNIRRQPSSLKRDIKWQKKTGISFHTNSPYFSSADATVVDFNVQRNYNLTNFRTCVTNRLWVYFYLDYQY